MSSFHKSSVKVDILKERVEEAYGILKKCKLCPRECGVDRLAGGKGFCRTGRFAGVSSAFGHFGEEPPLVGIHGSGAVFFTGCSLGCVFCQNYTISHLNQGKIVSEEELSGMMLMLQESGCHNINLVTPTHVVPQIMKALITAIDKGLNIPLVYNTGGYESVETLRMLDGVIDVYMPDAKFSDADVSGKLADAPDYFVKLKSALIEMHRQVGDLEVDERGIAARGLIIRHLVMPGGTSDVGEIMKFISERVSKNSYINLMDQYRPEFRAGHFPEINRRITSAEFSGAVDIAAGYGLVRLQQQ